MQSDSTFCDITIKVDSRSFPAHSNILAASSGYFKELFTTAQFEDVSNPVILLDEGDVSTFEVILDYIYTADKTRVTSGNVSKVLNMAIHLQIESVTRACIHFLDSKLRCGYTKSEEPVSQTISLQHAFEITQYVEPSLSDVVELAKDYISRNFIFLSKQSEFVVETSTECMTACLEVVPRMSTSYLYNEKNEVSLFRKVYFFSFFSKHICNIVSLTFIAPL